MILIYWCAAAASDGRLNLKSIQSEDVQMFSRSFGQSFRGCWSTALYFSRALQIMARIYLPKQLVNIAFWPPSIVVLNFQGKNSNFITQHIFYSIPSPCHGNMNLARDEQKREPSHPLSRHLKALCIKIQWQNKNTQIRCDSVFDNRKQ